MTKPLVLVIDDEPQMRKLLTVALETNDYKVVVAETGKEGLALAANVNPDLILLDISLPDVSGLELLSSLKSWYSRPVIMLSVLQDEHAIVQALETGANDYVTKPFRTAELMARIRTALRLSVPSQPTAVLTFEDLSLNMAAHTVHRNNEEIRLTATEFDLLCLLAKHAGRVLTHQFILKEIWGMGHQDDTPYLRVFIGTLRKKIEIDPNKPQHIITESRVGYRFH